MSHDEHHCPVCRNLRPVDCPGCNTQPTKEASNDPSVLLRRFVGASENDVLATVPLLPKSGFLGWVDPT